MRMIYKNNKEETMKVAIVTINEEKANYGNRLQNYATVKIMHKLGAATVDTLCIEKTKKSIQKMKAREMLQRFSGYRLPGDKQFWKFYAAKNIRFEKFSQKYTPYRFIDTVDKLKNDYDFFVVGSDQVWNPNWFNNHKLKKELYLLTFAEPQQKVCMAPSFGVSQLSDEWKVVFSEALRSFPYLSVREQSGAELIYDLTGREAKVVIDPTLMLSKDEWMSIEKKPKNIDTTKKYVLTYFLGKRTEKQDLYIKQMSMKFGLKVYDLLDISNRALFIADPREFIYLIHHAEIVLTDSFHACVFSFIFDKPFQAFRREGAGNMLFSRISNLLNTFALTDKESTYSLEKSIFNHNYDIGKKVLATEQKSSEAFLRDSMGLLR